MRRVLPSLLFLAALIGGLTPIASAQQSTTPISELREVPAADEGPHQRPVRRDTVQVTGRVTVGSGVLDSTRLVFYVQDATGGIRVFGGREAKSLVVQAGDSVVVRGVVVIFAGMPEIVGPSITVVPVPRRVPSPIVLREIRRGVLDSARGRLVTLSGTVVATSVGHGDEVVQLKSRGAGADSTPVSAVDLDVGSTELQIGRFEPGDTLRVTGVLVRRAEEDGLRYYVYPRSEADVTPHRWTRTTWRRLLRSSAAVLVVLLFGAAGYRVRRNARVARERAGTALRRSEARFRSMIENAADMIAVLDDTGRYTYIAPSGQRLFGYSAGEKRGQSALDDIHHSDLPLIQRALAELLATPGQSIEVDARFRGLNGEWRNLEIVATNLLADQAVGGIVVNSRDVTERRESERALAEARARLDHLLQASPVGLFALEPAANGEGWRITWMAEGIERVLGYTVEEALAPDWWSTNLHPENAIAGNVALESIQTTGRSVHEYRLRQKDGSYRWIRDELRAVVDGDRFVEVVGASMDITEQRAAAEALGEAEAQLRQAQKMDAVGRLAGGMAHDFNNLLTVIISYSELALTEVPAGSRAREDLREIKAAGDRAAELTRQLLAFSRRQVVDARALDLNDVVRGMDGMLARLLGAELRLTTRLAADLACSHLDRGQMEQVLMNLVVNARDAMPDGGDLTIATENVTLGVEEAGQYADATAGPYVMLSVRDTGIGMDDATKARVFEPFFTTKGLGEGTGLGLATVYGIVKQFGGSIAVESAPGAGSTFRVLLPSADVAVESPTPTPAVRAPSRAVAPGGSDSGKYARGTVLLVEDNSAVRGATRKVLERHGHAVIEAENGEAALRILEDASQPVDVVVSDVVMPVLGGLQLIRRLEVLRPGTRVVLMSGFTADAMVNRGNLPAGITFLEKPFQAEALLGAVEEMLRVAPSASRLAASTEMPPLSSSPVVAIIDDTELNRVLGAVLLDDTYRVITHEGGPEAVQAMADALPHVILLDIEMPHLNGFELLRELRAHPMLRRTRVVAFTSRDSADDRRAYVAAGFDGFLGKPISDRDAFRHVVAGEVRIAALTE